MKKSILCIFMAVIITLSSVVPAMAVEDYSNTALTIINRINTYQPTDGELSSESGNPPLEVYGRFGRYLFYISELEKLVNVEAGAVLPEWVSQTLEHHKGIVKTQWEYFATEGLNKGAGYQEVIEYSIKKSSEHVNTVLDLVKNSDDKEGIYKTNFEAVKLNIKIWSESIKFMNDNTDKDMKSEEDKFNSVYLVVTQLNDVVDLSLNLGFTRPEESYEKSSSITHNILDDEGNLRAGYAEIFALSAFVDNSRLDEYLDKLTEQSKSLYDLYSELRVPLYAGNDGEPVKTLYTTKMQNVKKSNLREFIEYKDSEQVLYMPLYKSDKSLPTTEIGTDTVEFDIKDKRVEYYPVYIKTNNNLPAFSEDSIRKIGGTKNLPKYSSAVMNFMQFNNFVENGRANDFTTDLSYPLFMDVFGNIETYSGRIVVPAVSNMNLYVDNTYFPLNAYFINNYPMETISDSIASLLKGNTDSYAVFTTMKDVKGDIKNETFSMVSFEGNSIRPASTIGISSKKFTMSSVLPKIQFYTETKQGDEVVQIPFMELITKNEGSMWGLNDYQILGLKESVLKIDDTLVPFTFINESVPVDEWNYNYLYSESGDKRKLDNELIRKLVESCYNNPESEDYASLKSENTQRVTHGYKMGALFEPIHKKLTESVKNYNLYTPSIAELPGATNYISTLLIPTLEIALLIAIVMVLLRYVRNIKTMSIISLGVSILIIFSVNYGITTFYPAVLNTGFNGMVSKVLGDNGYYLTLYNIEKDLNSKSEFTYGDSVYSEKVLTPGTYIKVADLTAEEVKRYRAGEENAPQKDSDYYIPDWDTSAVTLGKQMFIKGTSMYMYVKNLTSSTITQYDDGVYNHIWDRTPEYTYYMPYLSILEGITKSVNTYTSGKVTPKTLIYSDGHHAYSGLSLSYFSSKYFIVDNESAMASEGEFKDNWELYNGGDYLNLKNALYLEKDEEYFPPSNEDRVKESRWYQVSVKDLVEREEWDKLDRKILNVNLNTKNFIIEMLPYMNNISDDVMLKIISIYATIEFNNEFSKSNLSTVVKLGDVVGDIIDGELNNVDYKTKIYPQRLELDSISIDEQLKLSLVNIPDLLKFNVTSIYRFVENEASWFGILLLGLNSLLLLIRSLIRITLITVTVIIILMYAVFVYAIQRDYTNKTVIGLIGIIAMSWGVYGIDMLINLIFIQFDKGSAGVLMMILLIWLIWNLVATGTYLLILEMIRRDLAAFGGNIVYGVTATVLSKANSVIKGGLATTSKTRAEKFDITRPDLEARAEEYQEYLNMDFNEKLLNRQETISTVIGNAKETAKDKLDEKFINGKTLKEIYALNKNAGVDEMKVIATRKVSNEVESYFKGHNILSSKEDGKQTFKGKMEDWSTVIDDNLIREDKFEYFKEKNGNYFFKNSNMSKELMQKAGVSYEEVGDNTLLVRDSDSKELIHMMASLKTPIYEVNMDKLDALRKVEGIISPNDYEIGNHAVYLADKSQAESIFGSDSVIERYRTQQKVKDYSDKVDSGFVMDNFDLVNGLAVGNEYIYGSVSKDIFRNLVDSDIKLSRRGNEAYMFDKEQRDAVMEIVSKSARYTEDSDDILFRDQTPVDKLMFKGEVEVKEKENSEEDDSENMETESTSVEKEDSNEVDESENIDAEEEAKSEVEEELHDDLFDLDIETDEHEK